MKTRQDLSGAIKFSVFVVALIAAISFVSALDVDLAPESILTGETLTCTGDNPFGLPELGEKIEFDIEWLRSQSQTSGFTVFKVLSGDVISNPYYNVWISSNEITTTLSGSDTSIPSYVKCRITMRDIPFSAVTEEESEVIEYTGESNAAGISLGTRSGNFILYGSPKAIVYFGDNGNPVCELANGQLSDANGGQLTYTFDWYGRYNYREGYDQWSWTWHLIVSSSGYSFVNILPTVMNYVAVKCDITVSSPAGGTLTYNSGELILGSSDEVTQETPTAYVSPLVNGNSVYDGMDISAFAELSMDYGVTPGFECTWTKNGEVLSAENCEISSSQTTVGDEWSVTVKSCVSGYCSQYSDPISFTIIEDPALTQGAAQTLEITDLDWIHHSVYVSTCGRHGVSGGHWADTCTGARYCYNGDREGSVSIDVGEVNEYDTPEIGTDSYCYYIESVNEWTPCSPDAQSIHVKYATDVNWALTPVSLMPGGICQNQVDVVPWCNNQPTRPQISVEPNGICTQQEFSCLVTEESVDLDNAFCPVDNPECQDDIIYDYRWESRKDGTSELIQMNQYASLNNPTLTHTISPQVGESGTWISNVQAKDPYPSDGGISLIVYSNTAEVFDCINCTSNGVCDPSLCPAEMEFECIEDENEAICYCYQVLDCTVETYDPDTGTLSGYVCDPSLCNTALPYCTDVSGSCICSSSCSAGHQACSSDADCPAGTPDCRDDGCCYEFTECENVSAPGACATKDDCNSKLGSSGVNWRCEENITTSGGSINPDDCENCVCRQILPSCNLGDGIRLTGETCDSDNDCPDGGFCSPETCQCVCEAPTECQASSSSCSIYDDCESAFGSGWKCSEVIDGGVTTCDCIQTTPDIMCGNGVLDSGEDCEASSDCTIAGQICTSSCQCRTECSNASDSCDATLCASNPDGNACVPDGDSCYCNECPVTDFQDCISSAECAVGQSCEGGICSNTKVLDSDTNSGCRAEAVGSGYACTAHKNANKEVNGDNTRGYCFPVDYGVCTTTLNPGACNEEYLGQVACDFILTQADRKVNSQIAFTEMSTVTNNKKNESINWNFDVDFKNGCVGTSESFGNLNVDLGDGSVNAGAVSFEVPRGYVCQYDIVMTAKNTVPVTQTCYAFSTDSALIPGESVPELPAITHPLGMYSTSPADAAEAYTKAFIAVDNCPGAEDSLTGAAAFLRSCNEGGANADLSCRLAQYYSQRAEEDMNFGRC